VHVAEHKVNVGNPKSARHVIMYKDDVMASSEQQS
jgi:hypothetical protein